MAITDSYNLQPSPPITLNGHEEATSNFQLQASPPTSEGNVSGTVRRPDGTAIPFATVKLFDSNGIPFEHTNTNPAGQFISVSRSVLTLSQLLNPLS
jgi:hypothetical protein